MSNELSNVDQSLPAHLLNEGVDTELLSELSKIVRPPRLKIVQALSGDEFSDRFEVGDVILTPSSEKIGSKDQSFHFVVLDFFRSWMQINQNDAIALGEPFLIEMSNDPNSELARRAQNPNTWFEPHPDPKLAEQNHQVRNCEVLNYVVMIDGIDNRPVLVNFFKGEYATGQKLGSLLQGFTAQGGPKYGRRFQAISDKHKGKLGSWYGLNLLDVTADKLYITEDELPYYREASQKIVNLRQSSQLDVSMSDQDADSDGKF